MLQQPHGIPGSGEDQKGTSSHTHDASHQYESRADHRQPVQSRRTLFLCHSGLLKAVAYLPSLLRLFSDFTESFPHRPITGQDLAHPCCNTREVPVQLSH